MQSVKDTSSDDRRGLSNDQKKYLRIVRIGFHNVKHDKWEFNENFLLNLKKEGGVILRKKESVQLARNCCARGLRWYWTSMLMFRYVLLNVDK